MSNSDRYTLETPENVEVEFELAGLGSRFCAMLIDSLLIALTALLLVVLLMVAGMAYSPILAGDGIVAGRLGRWLAAVFWIIVAALLFDGYFIFFELVMRGQTPGKRSMKVRVLRDDGTPVTINEVFVRNILRLVDFLPAAYAVGAIVMFCNPLWKRLGDIAAGTIVVKEGRLDYRARADEKYALCPQAVGPANSELTPEERRLITGFLQRRAELLPTARNALAERLARPLHEKYGGHCGDVERYLERLIEGRHYGP
ncbi:MAG: RDD family protein [Thermoguttaceae bacterium]